METVCCNLCGGAKQAPYASVPDYLLERLALVTQLVRCPDCGLVYQSPRPTLAEMAANYPPDYEPYADTTAGSQNNPLMKMAVDYGIRKRTRFLTRHQQGGRLLDVGCAMGAFLVGMRNLGGWEVQGVEITPAVAAAARTRYGLDIFTGTLEEARFADNQFDAISLWDVFEHLHNPSATLNELQRVLKPGGFLLLRVPNLASWDAKTFGSTWAGLDAPRHTYVFTPETQRRMLEEHGLPVVEQNCAIGSYVTWVLSVRFWMTAQGYSRVWRDRVSKLLYHPVMRVASVPFFYLSNLNLKGPLLVTIARKPVA